MPWNWELTTNDLLTCFDGAEAKRMQTFCMLRHDWRIDEFQYETVQSDKSCKANENKRCLLNQHGSIDIWGKIGSLQKGIRMFLCVKQDKIPPGFAQIGSHWFKISRLRQLVYIPLGLFIGKSDQVIFFIVNKDYP